MTDRDDRLSADLQDYYRQLAQRQAPDVTARVMLATEGRTARMQGWRAVGGGLLGAAAVAAVIVVALLNHGSSPVIAPAHSPTPAPTTSPTGSPTPTPTPRVTVVGPPVSGFVPTDVTAVSAAQWWVLGYNGPSCTSASCTRIVHTTDGGQTFTSIPVPPVAPAQGSQQTVRLRFADPSDGWVVSATAAVWATHDGGSTWTQDSGAGSVSDLEASAGSVYAITCVAAQSCTLEQSATGQDAWTPLPASAGHGQLSHLNVNGAKLWVADGNPAGGPGTILASTDGGRTLSTETVCPSALGFGSLYAVDGSVLWATCITGTEASAYRSIDGGQHFTHLAGPAMLPNEASIAGVSSTTAVVGAGTLVRTVDGGQTFTRVEAVQTQWTVVGFTTSVNGFAFEVVQPAGHLALWRTNDAGAHWAQVRFP